MPRSTRPAAALAGIRALVVDDDADVASMLATVLRVAGARADVVTDHRAVADAFTRSQAHVVLLDWRLGSAGNAEAVLEDLERLRSGVGRYTLVITGDLRGRGGAPEAHRRGLQVLTKPFRPAELIDAVKRLLGR